MKKFHVYLLVLLIAFSFYIELLSSELTKIYPAPAEEILYEGYAVRINGQEVPVYSARVSAFPLNQRWPGYQRPKYQTEFAGFCSWDMNGPVTIEVIPHHVDNIDQVVVRPQSIGIVHKINKDTIVFSMKEPLQITVEVNGMHHALHLFGNPMEENIPNPDDPNVIYFAPGVHDIGKVDLTANQTVYIAGGAVVYGAFEARDAPNLIIRGRGILDGSRIVRPDTNLSKAPDVPFGMMAIYGCHNARVEGITLRDANVYVIMPDACNNMSIINIKEIGMWRYNTDGLVVNGYQWHRGYYCGELPTRNITATRCVIWNDWNTALRVGVVCDTPLIENIIFRDCDIIHASRIALNLKNHGRTFIRNILFEDIRIEMDDGSSENQYQLCKNQVYSYSNKMHVPQLFFMDKKKSMYTLTKEYGHIKDVV